MQILSTKQFIMSIAIGYEIALSPYAIYEKAADLL
jgi:hypothetical protein